MDLLFRGQRCR